MVIEMSAMPKTWILDLDGTIVRHNGYKIDGKDSLLEGAERFLSQIQEEDTVIFVTSRKTEFKEITESFLRENKIRFDHIIYDIPYGERILVNDRKPSGLQMAYAVNVDRDTTAQTVVIRNSEL